jgi:hypothetical protein
MPSRQLPAQALCPYVALQRPMPTWPVTHIARTGSLLAVVLFELPLRKRGQANRIGTARAERRLFVP